ncbi:MAG: hypothetical protein JWQ04_691 [Pedosphaera sp.]|nr:hypothetical protein [Pedosphaera sp.]
MSKQGAQRRTPHGARENWPIPRRRSDLLPKCPHRNRAAQENGLPSPSHCSDHHSHDIFRLSPFAVFCAYSGPRKPASVQAIRAYSGLLQANLEIYIIGQAVKKRPVPALLSFPSLGPCHLQPSTLNHFRAEFLAKSRQIPRSRSTLNLPKKSPLFTKTKNFPSNGQKETIRPTPRLSGSTTHLPHRNRAPPRTAPELAASRPPLLHAMEERAGERRRCLPKPTSVFANKISLSPALSHSCVVGEGEASGAVRGCAHRNRQRIFTLSFCQSWPRIPNNYLTNEYIYRGRSFGVGKPIAH